MNKVQYRIGTMCFFLWIIASCSDISSAPLTPTPSSFIPSATATLPMTASPRQTDVATDVAIPQPTLTKEQAEEIIGELLATNEDCTKPCFWGFNTTTTVDEETVLNYFTFLRERPRIIRENQNTRFIVSMGYQDRVNISLTFTFDGKQQSLINIYSAIHGLHYPEITNQDWEAFRPETILRTYGKPSSIEFFLNYPTESTSDQTIGYDFTFRYGQEKFAIMYTGQRTLNRPELRVCPLEDPTIVSVYLLLGDRLMENQLSSGKNIEEVSSLTIDDFYKSITENNPDICFLLDRASFTQ
jgi:hypothetical protein